MTFSNVCKYFAVLRRQGKPNGKDLQPEQKRRKLDGHFVELRPKTDDKMSPVSTIVPAEKSVPIESPKRAEVIQGSPVLGRKPEAQKITMKSTLSTLLDSNQPPTLNNTVIITRTAVGKTTDQFKPSEVSPSKVTAASGINISVSVVADANKQVQTSPKKMLTQAETGKMLMTMTAIKEVTHRTAEVKSLPNAETSKQTKRKAEKQNTLPASLPVSQMELKTPSPSIKPGKKMDKKKKTIANWQQ